MIKKKGFHMPIKMTLNKTGQIVRVYSIFYLPNSSKTSALYWEENEKAWHWTNLAELSPLPPKEKKEDK